MLTLRDMCFCYFKEHRYIELFLNSTAGGGSGMGGYGRDGMGMFGFQYTNLNEIYTGCLNH